MKKTKVSGSLLISTAFLLSTISFAAPIDLRIISDNSWRSNDALVAGWEMQSFNDNGWAFARSPYPPVDPTILIPGTTAQNIWHDPAGTSNGATGPIEAFFRFTFNLDIQPDSLPLIGQALISVDDDYDLFVNGNLAFQNHDGGFAHIVDFVDFTSKLQNGVNVIAIHAVDGGWSNPRDRTFERVLFDGKIATVSEPKSLVIFALGILGLGFTNRRRNRSTLPQRI